MRHFDIKLVCKRHSPPLHCVVVVQSGEAHRLQLKCIFRVLFSFRWPFMTAPHPNWSSVRKTDDNCSSLERKIGYTTSPDIQPLYLECRAIKQHRQRPCNSLFNQT
ncbi:hypothetical protein AVEN_230018-1 [Araneus ventricosus]|uniref:Uncharacterized protein n=1 Tax=Araneus ventricosus TaxID=182803 RepID=A0A4Y2CV61_ARAVE|nr:hypothetical protein AVEN_230018-1 [Araneus ventricosus]